MKQPATTAFFIGLVGLLALFGSCKKSVPDPAPKVIHDTLHVKDTVYKNIVEHDTLRIPPPIPAFAKGADVGWYTQMIAQGSRFYDTLGAQQDLFAILAGYSINAIRLRAWVHPASGYNNTNDVLAKARLAQAAGMHVMIDFHYSDTWADPGAQTPPVAWASYTADQLKGAVYTYTRGVLDTLKANGIHVDWAQVGNETTNGMLWPLGKASTHMNTFAALIDTGYAAVKAVDTSTKVIVHLANGFDNSNFRFIFGGLKHTAPDMI